MAALSSSHTWLAVGASKQKGIGGRGGKEEWQWRRHTAPLCLLSVFAVLLLRLWWVGRA